MVISHRDQRWKDMEAIRNCVYKKSPSEHQMIIYIIKFSGIFIEKRVSELKNQNQT
jgi:hypothetical protein